MLKYQVYEYNIINQLEQFPKELCFMVSEEDVVSAPDKLREIVSWAAAFSDIRKIIFYISTAHHAEIENLLSLSEVSRYAAVMFSSPAGEKSFGSGNLQVLIVLGKCGTEEITDAVIRIAREDIEPEKIDESVIEAHLSYKVNPDFIIKTGKSHLTDFLIWQSVYAELLFSDINWDKFRRVDFLRALRDFQSRTRRYGK